MQRVFLKHLRQWNYPLCYQHASVTKTQCKSVHRSSLIQYSICLTTYPQQYNSNSFRVISDHPEFLRFKLVFPVCISHRKLHTSHWTKEKESSKVEKTVKALKEAEKTKQEKEHAPVAAMLESKPATIPPKRSLGKRIVDEIIHYYHGFRLLFIDFKVSSRLVWKVLNGDDLSRREHRQLVRTVSDVFRILPFSVFIIVPFMELLLPLAIKLFPQMLPSTFETKSEKEVKMKKELKVKLEMAKFLQNTLDEMALQQKGDKHSHNAKEFVQFFEKIRTSGEQASNEEIIKFSKLFEDEITLDSLGRPQIIALCRLLQLQPIGTNNFLRFQLRMKLRSLRADDQMIQKEGVDILTVNELQFACKARGMRALGVSEERLRSQLQQWLELSLNENIPPSLLLLSRALYVPEHLPAAEQLKATISALPEKAAMEAKLKIGEKEGKVDNKTKIEVIKQEEAAIKMEQEEKQEEEKEKLEREVAATAKAVGEAAEKESIHVMQEATETVPISKKAQVEDILQDAAPILEDKAKEIEALEMKVKKEDEFSKEDFDDLEDALQKIADEKKQLLIEKEELEELKEEMADYKEDIEEFKEVVLKTGESGLTESKAASRLSNRVNKMIVKMGNLLDELDIERKSLQQQIDFKVKEGVSIQQEERDNIISINELVLAIRRIQKVSDDTRLQRIADVLERMDIDHDGAVEIDHCMKVIELLGKENVKVTTNQMNDIIELLMKEENLEMAEKLRKQKARLEEQAHAEDLSKHAQGKQDQKAVKNPE